MGVVLHLVYDLLGASKGLNVGVPCVLDILGTLQIHARVGAIRSTWTHNDTSSGVPVVWKISHLV